MSYTDCLVVNCGIKLLLLSVRSFSEYHRFCLCPNFSRSSSPSLSSRLLQLPLNRTEWVLLTRSKCQGGGWVTSFNQDELLWFVVLMLLSSLTHYQTCMVMSHQLRRKHSVCACVCDVRHFNETVDSMVFSERLSIHQGKNLCKCS